MVDDGKASQALQQQLEALRRENALLQGEVRSTRSFTHANAGKCVCDSTSVHNLVASEAHLYAASEVL